MFNIQGVRKVFQTPVHILNWLIYQYHTSKKPIITFFMVFMRYKNVSPHFKKGVNGINSYLVIYHRKCLFIRKIVTLRKGFYVSTTSLMSNPKCLTLIGCNFGLDWRTHLLTAPLFFFYTAVKKSAPDNGLKIKHFVLPLIKF